VPLVVSGGSAALRAAAADAPSPCAVDVAPTIVALLGLRAPRRTDGTVVPAALVGRPIAAVLSAAAR
jgi:arylsulfatase A-like enzyme